MKNNWNLLIFDLDGTLCETAQDIATSVNQTLITLGYPSLPLETVIGFIGDGIETLLQRAMEYVSYSGSKDTIPMEKIVSRYKTFYDRNLLEHTRPYEGVFSTLERLTIRPMGVISNKSYYFTRRILDHFALSRFFEFILGGDSLIRRKPHPYPLEFVLNHYRLTPDQALLIGDSEKDCAAAQAVGMPVCLVTYGMRPYTALAELNPDYLIADFGELLEIIN